MNERDLQKKCLAYARDQGCFARKVETPAHNGFPDCIFHFKGKTLYVEFKNPNGKGKVSPIQAKDHQRLEAVGMTVYVVDDFSYFRGVLNAWIRL
ncbi:MAG: hypothetical protein CMQ19_00470 [Gammaproteobacteria bacterium]|nr:hypothetical protein [Gammaproteobacteria bacterium]|tara:strand:+ start:1096 stop:1380 length:285 start_codon:yes stop_codon:yes gene_type:complete